jgi:hypothetical protein
MATYRSNATVTPYPGVHYDEVLKVLKEAHTSVINIRGKSHDIGKLVDNYLNWVDENVRMMRYRLSAADIDRLFLTRRYWAIQSSPGGGSAGVVGTEIDDREAELTETIRWVEDRQRKWTQSDGRLVIADSGFFLNHEQKLCDIPFADILDLRDEPVRLMLPILVLDELDSLKQHNKAQIRWRAGYTLGVLDEVLQPNGTGILREADFTPLEPGGLARGRVSVEVFFDQPGHRRLPINDDEIIDRAVTIQAEAGRQVAFWTFDTAQSTRARFAGLRVKKFKRDPGAEPSANPTRQHGD